MLSPSVYPEKPIKDVLVFEVPLKTAEASLLELPDRNFGADGVYRFRIPTEGLTP